MRPWASPFPTLDLSLPRKQLWVMAVVSEVWISELGKVSIFIFELAGCLVQQPGETCLVLAFNASGLFIF